MSDTLPYLIGDDGANGLRPWVETVLARALILMPIVEGDPQAALSVPGFHDYLQKTAGVAGTRSSTAWSVLPARAFRSC
jgi:hypothetical protein